MVVLWSIGSHIVLTLWAGSWWASQGFGRCILSPWAHSLSSTLMAKKGKCLVWPQWPVKNSSTLHQKELFKHICNSQRSISVLPSWPRLGLVRRRLISRCHLCQYDLSVTYMTFSSNRQLSASPYHGIPQLPCVGFYAAQRDLILEWSSPIWFALCWGGGRP